MNKRLPNGFKGCVRIFLTRRDCAAAEAASQIDVAPDAARCTVAFLHEPLSHPLGAEIGRDGVEAARWHQRHTSLLSGRVVLVDHRSVPADLAVDVHVVSAVLDARSNDWSAVQRKRPSRREEAHGLGGDLIRMLRRWSDEDWRRRSERVRESAQLLLIPTGDGPTQRRLACSDR